MKVATMLLAAFFLGLHCVVDGFQYPSAYRAATPCLGSSSLLQRALRPTVALRASSPGGLDNVAAEMAAIVADATSAPTDMEMGARVDPAATGAFVFCGLVFGILRLKVAGAMAVKDERLRAELTLQGAKVAAMKGSDSDGAL